MIPDEYLTRLAQAGIGFTPERWEAMHPDDRSYHMEYVRRVVEQMIIEGLR